MLREKLNIILVLLIGAGGGKPQIFSGFQKEFNHIPQSEIESDKGGRVICGGQSQDAKK